MNSPDQPPPSVTPGDALKEANVDNESLHQRLSRGEPVVFPKPPAVGSESAEARAHRTIKAAWIEALAERPGRKVLVPIVIRNAVIEGSLDLKYAIFECEVSINDSEFMGELDLSFATFKRNLILSKSTIHDRATFQSAVLECNAYLIGTKFLTDRRDDKESLVGRAHFSDLYVRGVWVAQEISFGEGVDADFERAHFEKSAFFRAATFGGPANFRSLRIDGHAEFDAAQFNGKGIPVDFQFAIIEASAYIRRASFAGAALFGNVRIQELGFFQGAVFKGKVSFNGARLRGAFFRHEPKDELPAASFEDEADFEAAHFEVNAEFNGVQFSGEEKVVNFSRARIEGDAFFQGTSFAGEARFISVRIAARALFQGAVFHRSAVFNGARVGGFALFRAESAPKHNELPGATFGGVADFRWAQIDSNAEFDECVFTGPTHFAGAQIGGRAFFRRAKFGENSKPSFRAIRFQLGVSLECAEFNSRVTFRTAFFDVDAHFHGVVFRDEAIFDGSHFAGDALFTGVRQEEGCHPGAIFFAAASFEQARFDQDANFEETSFLGKTSFRETSFRVVFFSLNGRVGEQEQFHNEIDLRGCVYERIQVNHQALLRRVWRGSPDQPEYDRQPYVQLENVFRQLRDEHAADEIYVEGWKAAREYRWKSRDYKSWLRSATYGLLAHYGQRPWRLVIIPPILQMLISSLIFSRPYAVQPNSALRARVPPSPGAEMKTGAAVVNHVSETLSKGDALRLSTRLLSPVEVPLAGQWEPSERPLTTFKLGLRVLTLRFSDFATILRISA